MATTSDGGSSWSVPEVVGTVSGSVELRSGAVDIRYAGNNGWIYGPGVFETHDGGRSWHRTLTAPIVALEPFANTVWAVEGCSTQAAGCNQTLLVSQPASDNWQPASPQPPFARSPIVDSSAPGIAIERAPGDITFLAAAGTDGHQGLYVTRDLAHSWGTLKAPCGQIASIRSLNGENVWVLCSTPCCTGNYVKALFTSADGGASWDERAASGVNTLGSIPFSGPAGSLVVTSSTTALFGASGDAGIWRTTDSGTTWNAVFTDACVQGGNAMAHVRFADSLHGWAVADHVALPCPTLVRTTDGGRTWAPAPSPFQPASG